MILKLEFKSKVVSFQASFASVVLHKHLKGRREEIYPSDGRSRDVVEAREVEKA